MPPAPGKHGRTWGLDWPSFSALFATSTAQRLPGEGLVQQTNEPIHSVASTLGGSVPGCAVQSDMQIIPCAMGSLENKVIGQAHSSEAPRCLGKVVSMIELRRDGVPLLPFALFAVSKRCYLQLPPAQPRAVKANSQERGRSADWTRKHHMREDNAVVDWHMSRNG